MGQYDEDINRIIRDFDLERIETQTDFWNQYFAAFGKKAHRGFGERIIDRLLARKTLGEKIIFQSERPSERQLGQLEDMVLGAVTIRGKIYTIYRNRKTGRFVKYAGSR